jgi:hypothetical protein
MRCLLRLKDLVKKGGKGARPISLSKPIGHRCPSLLFLYGKGEAIKAFCGGRKKHTTRLIMYKFKLEISNRLGFVLLQKTARSETSTVPSPQDVSLLGPTIPKESKAISIRSFEV